MIRRQQRQADMPMDSLLDILSNLVGMMIFLIITAVLCSKGIKVVLNTVLRPPQASQAVYFVCRSGTITQIDPALSVKELGTLKKELTDATKTPSVQELVREANRREIGSDANYHVEFVREALGSGTGRRACIGLRFYTQGPQQGQTVTAVEERDGEFRKCLDRATARNLLYFYVYPDGVEVFDVARNMARATGLEVGWRPMLPDQTVGFSGFAAELTVGG
jgi:hypothetical protein